MSDPFIGEIRMFGGNFAPRDWAFCDGQPLAISQNDALYALIGTIYGGDGQSVFNLPDLRGRIPVHQGISTSTGSTFVIGQLAGTETVTLTPQQMPQHVHAMPSNSNAGSSSSPAGNIPAQTNLNPYASPPLGAVTQMGNQMIGSAGGSQPHDNMMPYLCVNFIISLYGIFPSQN